MLFSYRFFIGLPHDQSLERVFINQPIIIAGDMLSHCRIGVRLVFFLLKRGNGIWMEVLEENGARWF
jgi:hypothetical protein